MLVLTAIGSVVLVVVGRRIRGRAAATVLSRVFAVVLFGFSVVNLIRELLPSVFNIAGSIPLQLSDVLRFVCAYALWSRRFWAVSLVYYWALSFNVQSLVTPNLHLGAHPVYEFIAYWAPHILVMWTVMLLIWGLGQRPDWRSYRLAILATLIWAIVAFTFNVLAGTNYGFLNATPASPSLLDVMGPWPIYLLVAFVAMFVVWALMTLPWTVRRRISSDLPGTPASPD